MRQGMLHYLLWHVIEVGLVVSFLYLGDEWYLHILILQPYQQFQYIIKHFLDLNVEHGNQLFIWDIWHGKCMLVIMAHFGWNIKQLKRTCLKWYQPILSSNFQLTKTVVVWVSLNHRKSIIGLWATNNIIHTLQHKYCSPTAYPWSHQLWIVV